MWLCIDSTAPDAATTVVFSTTYQVNGQDYLIVVIHAQTSYIIQNKVDMNEARYAEVYNRVVMSYHCT